MKEFYILKNPIQDYGWGSHTAIPELLGTPERSGQWCKNGKKEWRWLELGSFGLQKLALRMVSV